MFEKLSIGMKHFQKGETILRQGNAVDFLYFLESGDCYRRMTTDKGDTIIYEIKQSGNSIASLLGVLNLYNHDPISCFSFVAKTECICQCIPADAFRAWAEADPKVMKEILIHSMEVAKEVRLAFQSYQEGRIANRLCRLMINCSDIIQGRRVLPKDVSLSEMAAMLGVHPVTVSRIVRALCDQEVLKKEKGTLWIRDYGQLEAYAQNGRNLSYK